MNENKITTYFIALGAFALGMGSYMTAGLIPMIEAEFQVSTAAAAQLVTAFTLGYGLGSPVFVAVLPAARQRSGLLVALAVFTLAHGASALTRDLAALLAYRVVGGIGAGVYLALGISAAVGLAAENWRGKSISIIMGGMASGTVLGVPASLLVAGQAGWQAAFWGVAVLGVLTFAGLAVKLPRLPEVSGTSFLRKLAVLGDRQVLLILLVSLLAAVSSLGMYTFIAPFLASVPGGSDLSVVPFLWAWGVGGVLGSLLIGPLVDSVRGPRVAFGIMGVLALCLGVLPLGALVTPWLCVVPLAVWGAVGWALQVPQNNELLKARTREGDGNLAVALNESALYLGSAIGAAAGGGLLLLQVPLWALPVSAAAIAAVGAGVQGVLAWRDVRRPE
ncbi:MFS transporter [Phaeovibrio sulfidiphilus]|uniref:MFS transporter n=1 Tax=Phaeovibrio sulfidiphilus TaxID=1220600 RepID=A0A8J6YKT8_9PROT|nr:MFS transporter [Phaeovibrio sulfidiphilus]MBE1236125.1 MFS transporter [Phaeovibrio sulfidiphilus]